MKTLLTLLLLFSFQTLWANELEWVDEQIESIKPPRPGMSSKETRRLKDPFLFLKETVKKDAKNSSTQQSTRPSAPASSRPMYTKSSKVQAKVIKNQKFYLSIIMNKSARINNKWFKLGESINGYKIVEIAKSTVILMKGKKKFSLSTNSKNLTLNFKN